MPKSPDAFRTISEVADWLGIQAHVLRFWESKFTQVRPVKRAGGRRYYRPGDMLLLGGIKQLLHEDGLTIKGVQKILREDGMSHVAALSPPLDELTQSQIEEAEPTPFIEAPEETVEEKGVVLNFEQASPVEDLPAVEEAADAVEPEEVESQQPQEAPEEAAAAPAEETPSQDPPALADTDLHIADPAQTEDLPTQDLASEPESLTATLPAFLRRPMAEEPAATDNPPAQAAEPEEIEPQAIEPQVTEPQTIEPEAPPPPMPRVIDLPAFTPEQDFAASPAILTKAHGTKRLTTAQAKQIAPLLAKLSVLRDSMTATRSGTTNPGAND